MEGAFTMVMLVGVMVFSLATAVLIEEMIFGGLSRVVLGGMGRKESK